MDCMSSVPGEANKKVVALAIFESSWHPLSDVCFHQLVLLVQCVSMFSCIVCPNKKAIYPPDQRNDPLRVAHMYGTRDNSTYLEVIEIPKCRYLVCLPWQDESESTFGLIFSSHKVDRFRRETKWEVISASCLTKTKSMHQVYIVPPAFRGTP